MATNMSKKSEIYLSRSVFISTDRAKYVTELRRICDDNKIRGIENLWDRGKQLPTSQRMPE
jgi:hypothetical protein